MPTDPKRKHSIRFPWELQLPVPISKLFSIKITFQACHSWWLTPRSLPPAAQLEAVSDWGKAHVSLICTYCASCLQNSLHSTNGQIPVYKYKWRIFASHQQCSYPFGRKWAKTRRKKRLHFVRSNVAGNDKYAPELFRIKQHFSYKKAGPHLPKLTFDLHSNKFEVEQKKSSILQTYQLQHNPIM